MQNVRHFVHALRSQLEPDRAPRARSSFIIAHEGGYELDTSRIAVDPDDFEDHAHAGLRALQRSESGPARESLEQAAALYEGDFLADEPYAEWTLAERGRLHELASRTFSGLADLALDAGAAETATAHLYRLARLEPLDSDVQRRLLRCCWFAGARARRSATTAALTPSGSPRWARSQTSTMPRCVARRGRGRRPPERRGDRRSPSSPIGHTPVTVR